MDRGLIKYRIARLNIYYASYFVNPIFDLSHKSGPLFAQIYETLKDKQKLGIDDFVSLGGNSAAETKLEVHTYDGQSRIEIYPSSLVIYAIGMIQAEADMKVCLNYITDCENICRRVLDIGLRDRKFAINLWAKIDDDADTFKKTLNAKGYNAFPFVNDLPLGDFFDDQIGEIKKDFSLHFSVSNALRSFKFTISESPSPKGDIFIRCDISLPPATDLLLEHVNTKKIFDETMLNLGLSNGADT